MAIVCSAADEHVAGRRVDDDDAALGGRLDVDVVDADAGAADDLEVASPASMTSAVTLVAERMISAS